MILMAEMAPRRLHLRDQVYMSPKNAGKVHGELSSQTIDSEKPCVSYLLKGGLGRSVLFCFILEKKLVFFQIRRTVTIILRKMHLVVLKLRYEFA